MSEIQLPLFKIERPFPFDRDYGFTCLGYQPPIPGHDEGNKWRVGGFDMRTGIYRGLGFCDRDDVSGGYVVFLQFEDGAIEAFHPYSIFPVINK